MSMHIFNKRLFFGVFIFTFILYIYKSTTSVSTNLTTFEPNNKNVTGEKMAFVTFLCDDVMGEATEVLVYSLKKTETKHDIVVLVLDEVTDTVRNRLEYLGAKIINVDQVKYPWDSDNARRKGFNKACRYSKLNLWNLTQYKKVVFLDADTMVVQSIDELFEYPQFTAVVDIGGVLNTGVFIAEPNRATYQDIMATYENAPSYNKGDQGFLNYYFNQSANPLPGNYNLMVKFTHFSALAMSFVTKNTVKVLHFTSETKPWNFHFLHQREWRENYDGYLFGFWTRTKREMLNELEQGGLYQSDEWDNKKRVDWVCDRAITRGYGRKYPNTEQFSVLLQLTKEGINTKYFEKLLKMYVSSDKVNQIIVNRDRIKNEHGKFIRLNSKYFQNTLRIDKPIKVVPTKGFKSPNNRFNPIKYVQTNAVYIVDENAVSSIRDIEFAYSVWQRHMDSVVGFRSDGHSDRKFIENMDQEEKYSMIRSSSGVFLKSDYLYGYTCLLPEQVHYYVDHHPECYDVAMNMMVSGMTGSIPILVGADSYHEIGPKKKDVDKLSVCIQELPNYFNNQNTLVYNDEVISRSRQQDTQHKTLSWAKWAEGFSFDYFVQRL